MNSSSSDDGTSFEQNVSGLRIALVHEWLSGIAGSEQTFMAMAEALPNAELFALSYNETSGLSLGERSVTTSKLNRLAQHGGRAALLPLMPWAMKHLGRSREFDIVITSSHAFSRAFASTIDARHLSYTYTPMRYAWYPELERHRSRLKVPGFALRPFRSADLRYADGVDDFASISTEIQERIQAIYGRPSRIVYPPCDTDYFSEGSPSGPRSGVVVAGRLVPYKRVDLAIEACARAGAALTVIGKGPERARLEKLAQSLPGAQVDFRGGVSRDELRATLASSEALIFPGREDFGIVPVEAQAAGTPVVAYGVAGALDTVVDHPGALVPEQTPEAFAAGLAQVLADPPSAATCRAKAEGFSRQHFIREFQRWVADSIVDATA